MRLQPKNVSSICFDRKNRSSARDATYLLHRISTELIGEQNIDALYRKIIDAAAQLARSPCASIQLLDGLDGHVVEFRLLGCRGFVPEVVTRWKKMRVSFETDWAKCLFNGKRFLVSNVGPVETISNSDLNILRCHRRHRGKTHGTSSTRR